VQTLIYSGHERRDWLRQRSFTIIIAIAFIFMVSINLEQGRVIESQRALIHLLAGDSTELAMRRVQEIQRHR
jgi:hypothetical protein